MTTVGFGVLIVTQSPPAGLSLLIVEDMSGIGAARTTAATSIIRMANRSSIGLI